MPAGGLERLDGLRGGAGGRGGDHERRVLHRGVGIVDGGGGIRCIHDIDGHGGRGRLREAVAGAVGEGRSAGELGSGREGEAAVGVEHGIAVGRLRGDHGGDAGGVYIAVVQKHALRRRDHQRLALRSGKWTVIHRDGRIIHRLDSDSHGRRCGFAGAVHGFVSERIRAEVVGLGSIAEGTRGVDSDGAVSRVRDFHRSDRGHPAGVVIQERSAGGDEGHVYIVEVDGAVFTEIVILGAGTGAESSEGNDVIAGGDAGLQRVAAPAGVIGAGRRRTRRGVRACPPHEVVASGNGETRAVQHDDGLNKFVVLQIGRPAPGIALDAERAGRGHGDGLAPAAGHIVPGTTAEESTAEANIDRAAGIPRRILTSGGSGRTVGAIHIVHIGEALEGIGRGRDERHIKTGIRAGGRALVQLHRDAVCPGHKGHCQHHIRIGGFADGVGGILIRRDRSGCRVVEAPGFHPVHVNDAAVICQDAGRPCRRGLGGGQGEGSAQEVGGDRVSSPTTRNAEEDIRGRGESIHPRRGHSGSRALDRQGRGFPSGDGGGSLVKCRGLPGDCGPV